MPISALFDIDPGTGTFGTSGVAQDVSIDGATVNCRLASTSGVVSVVWSIHGTHGAAAPSITNSTSTEMSFAVPAGGAQAYGITCTVTDGAGNTDTKTSAVYVPGMGGKRPFFVGEKFERDSTYATVPDLNRAVAGFFGKTDIKAGKTVLAGGAGGTQVQTYAHSMTGDGTLLVEMTVAAVDTGTPDVAIYKTIYAFRVAAGGNPSSGTFVSVGTGETDSSWNAGLGTSGANIVLTLTPDGTNDTTFIWSLAITELDAEAA